jgi:bifunctional ADP-heptose synthase (sugar kinase/adenylyltransferase)
LPDVLVKGGDYKIDDIVGAKEVTANGGTVQTIDFVDGFSTTNYFKKLKDSTI